MRKLIFPLLSVLALFSFASSANAICLDSRGDKFDPVAVADSSGVITVMTKRGQLKVSGFAPGAELCRNLLFVSAGRKCPDGLAKLDAARAPKFCKRVHTQGRTCVHIQCDGKGN